MKKFFVVVACLLLTETVFSQNTYKFLGLDTSPRAAAVAGSFVANNDDPNVIFYNPAGLNFLENTPVSFSYLKHLLDINAASVVVSNFRLGKIRRGCKIY